MNVKTWLKKVAYIKEYDMSNGNKDPDFICDCYFSNFDNSYITIVGLEDDIKYLADREITEQLTHGVGFSLKDNKWYGWSHRAIYGFEIGSTCKKGDCHYIGSSIEEQEEAAIEFWKNKYHKNVKCIGIITQDGKEFFDIKWNYLNIIPNKKLISKIGGVTHLILPLGKGEWTAETMEDAKQMAIDFNQGVS